MILLRSREEIFFGSFVFSERLPSLSSSLRFFLELIRDGFFLSPTDDSSSEARSSSVMPASSPDMKDSKLRLLPDFLLLCHCSMACFLCRAVEETCLLRSCLSSFSSSSICALVIMAGIGSSMLVVSFPLLSSWLCLDFLSLCLLCLSDLSSESLEMEVFTPSSRSFSGASSTASLCDPMSSSLFAAAARMRLRRQKNQARPAATIATTAIPATIPTGNPPLPDPEPPQTLLHG
mmetsp:Transcript_18563/g.33474  ORF Transcript_18563/g.33474 Transcript_18563/m.33474 type:complete len:234 (-) Transcript_18563:393-1094(-)